MNHERHFRAARAASLACMVYSAAMTLLFPFAAPYGAEGGGYSRITGFKFLCFVILTGLFLLVVLPLRLRSRRLRLPRVTPMTSAALGLLLWSCLSALLSPYRAAALLGGSRREGLLTLALYVLPYLTIRSENGSGLPHQPLLLCAGLSLGLGSALCLRQMAGGNPLGLYPPELGWADANLRYAGSYLGSLGNADATCALLCTLSALCLLSLLRKGGLRWLLLPPLTAAALVLGRSGVSAACLALLAILLLALPASVRRMEQLVRVLAVYPPVLAALLFRELQPLHGLALTATLAAAYFLWRFAPPERPVRLWMWVLALGLSITALAYVYGYTGWRIPLREASALLHGHAEPDFGSGRLYIWEQVWGAVRERPWLGGGPDTLALRGLEPYVWRSVETGRTVVSSIDAAHNEYLHTLVCQGIPAAACHLALSVLALLRFLRRGDSPAGVCAGAALCYGIRALFGISACAAAPAYWLLLGFSEALQHHQESRYAFDGQTGTGRSGQGCGSARLLQGQSDGQHSAAGRADDAGAAGQHALQHR